MVVSPDGSTLLTADEKGVIVYWSLPDMKVLHTVRAHGDRINSIIFNKRGTKFVTCADDGKIRIWNFEKKLVMNTWFAPYGRVNFAVISPDDRWIYFGGYRSNDESYTSNQVFTGLYRVGISDNGGMELMYSDDDVMSYYGTNWGITDGNLDPTGKYIVFTKGYELLIWNISGGELEAKIKSPYNLNNVTPHGSYLYAWGDGRLIRWSKSNGAYTLGRTVTAGNTESGYSRIIFSADGKHFVTGDDGSKVNLWNTSTMTQVQVLSGHHGSVRAFAFCQHDSLIITGGYDGKVVVWGHPPKEEDPVDTVDADTLVVVKDTIPPVVKDTVAEVKDTVVQRDVVFTENNIPVMIKDRPVNKSGTFYVNTQEFEIEIWDNSVYDHDVISLNINGEWILENYEVTKEKKKIKIKVTPNTNNYLILYAHNLGEISPNTAAVGLVVGDKVQRLTVSSDLKQCGALNFEYRP